MIYFSRKKDLFTKFYLHVDLRRILKKSQKELKDEITHNQNQGKTTTLKVNVYTHPKNHMYPVCINHTEIEMKFESVKDLHNFVSEKQVTNTLISEKYSQQTEACEEVEKSITKHLENFGIRFWNNRRQTHVRHLSRTVKEN